MDLKCWENKQASPAAMKQSKLAMPSSAQHSPTYLKGVTSGDAESVLAVLSEERLARVERAGGIGRVMEEQAAQVRSAFGDDADFSDGIALQQVESFDSDQVLAATLSFRGQELPKRIYFIREGSQYKLNLLPPQSGVSSPKPGTLRQSLGYQVDYRIANQHSSVTEFFRYRATSGPGFSPSVQLIPLQTTARSVFADNCTNVFLDGTDFQGTNGSGMFWQTAVRCAYQAFGTVDFRLPSGSTLWACIQTCT